VVEQAISNLLAGLIGGFIVEVEVVTRRLILGAPPVLLTVGITVRSIHVAFAQIRRNIVLLIL